MGLIRTAIVAGICVSLIPAEQKDREVLYQRVEAAVAWTSTFCTRNQKTCENAEVLWAAFLDKGSFALASGYDIAIRHLTTSQDPAGPPSNQQTVYSQNPAIEHSPLPPLAPAGYHPDRGTLTAEDRQYRWRGPSNPNGA